jgi:uncharacterized protein YkwD
MSCAPISKRLLLFIPFFAFLPISEGRAQQSSSLPVGASVNLEFHNGLEQEAFSLVNEYRKKNKLPTLSWNSAIAKVARGHSKSMATGDVDFGHDGFNGRVGQLKIVMIGLRGCGENVLKTDAPDQVAQNAVALWLRSPAHLHNIRGDYNYSGMGVWENKQGMIYLTQIFVKLESQEESAQTMPAKVISPFGLLVPSRRQTQP